ncbi:hypothetical protein CF87_gp49 [Sulfolobus monocaudavirus SMV1]|uniref:hypothetical protein n=1 Tax=Sulfolobus monocaudavirus SMV1 TaxID=1351702 RepID=UPI0003D8D1A5|nr:hypothetical protein CF87_gp49 [Sulfolobus monocaudavirus SMV1]CDF81376.1 hypothetical protein [Sulfolobus monocaudavirus SMV1]
MKGNLFNAVLNITFNGLSYADIYALNVLKSMIFILCILHLKKGGQTAVYELPRPHGGAESFFTLIEIFLYLFVTNFC